MGAKASVPDKFKPYSTFQDPIGYNEKWSIYSEFIIDIDIFNGKIPSHGTILSQRLYLIVLWDDIFPLNMSMSIMNSEYIDHFSLYPIGS